MERKKMCLLVILLTIATVMTVIRSIDQEIADYNVKDYGARGDGLTDDTDAINAAIQDLYSHGMRAVIIPAGEYLIDPDISIRMMDNTKLIMAPDTVLKAKATRSGYNTVIKIGNVSNVEITGGRIIGERYLHTGSEGAQGHGIRITGSNNIRVADISVSDCWGDGIYVGSTPAQNYSRNVIIERINADNNRRNGLSIISAMDLVLRDSSLSNSNGVIPQSGLCIEPNDINEKLQNVSICNLRTKGNWGYGINFYILLNSEVTINIEDHIASGNKKGPYNKYMHRNETNPNYHINFS